MENGENLDGENKYYFGNVSVGPSHWTVGQVEGKNNFQTSIHAEGAFAHGVGTDCPGGHSGRRGAFAHGVVSFMKFGYDDAKNINMMTFRMEEKRCLT